MCFMVSCCVRWITLRAMHAHLPRMLSCGIQGTVDVYVYNRNWLLLHMFKAASCAQ